MPIIGNKYVLSINEQMAHYGLSQAISGRDFIRIREALARGYEINRNHVAKIFQNDDLQIMKLFVSSAKKETSPLLSFDGHLKELILDAIAEIRSAQMIDFVESYLNSSLKDKYMENPEGGAVFYKAYKLKLIKEQMDDLFGEDK